MNVKALQVLVEQTNRGVAINQIGLPVVFAAIDLMPGGKGAGMVGREVLEQAGERVAKGVSEASSALQGAQLEKYYSQLQKYGEAGIRELESVRFRFYGKLTPARTSGEMVGARLVREGDPATGKTRTWYETLDHAGNVRSVAPKPVTDARNHRIDSHGNYQGRR